MYFDSKNHVVDLENTSFFKYSPINYNTMKSLNSGKTWFSSPCTFNDPLDCTPPLILGDSKSLLDEGILESTFKTFKQIKSESVIFCLSTLKPTDEYSHLMWSHYAEDHKGICIEYEVDRNRVLMITEEILKKNTLPEKPVIMKVQYDIDELPNDELYILDMQVALFGLKAKAWDYEGECRIVSSGYKEPLKGCEMDFPGKTKSITFGLGTNDIDKEFIYTNFRNREFEFFEIKHKHGSYELEKVFYSTKR